MAKTYTCDCGRQYIPNVKYNDVRVRCNQCIRTLRSRDVKIKAVDYLGGKCIDCGYEGHAVAFDFDHFDPTQKRFRLSGHWLYRWKELQKELNKCELRCSNCHRIRHYKEQIENGQGSS